MTGEQEVTRVENERSIAQFFFEVGYGAAYADAFIANNGSPAFTLTDASIERAWAIAPEAYEDHAEWDRYMALATPPAIPSEKQVEASDSYAAWQQKRGILADRVDWAILEYDEFMKDDAFDAQRVLDRIIDKLRETRAALATLSPDTKGETA